MTEKAAHNKAMKLLEALHPGDLAVLEEKAKYAPGDAFRRLRFQIFDVQWERAVPKKGRGA